MINIISTYESVYGLKCLFIALALRYNPTRNILKAVDHTLQQFNFKINAYFKIVAMECSLRTTL